MAKTAYFDCFSGASGDMVLGALLDLGLPLEALRAALGSLAIEYGGISAERVLRAGVSATQIPRTRGRTPRACGSGPVARLIAMPRVTNTTRTRRARTCMRRTRRHDHGHRTITSTITQHADDREHAHEASHAHHSLKDIARYIERSALSPSREGSRAGTCSSGWREAEAAIHEMPVERVHLHEVGALDSIIDIVGAVFGMEWFGADAVVVLAAERRRRHGAVARTACFRCRRRRPRGCSATRRSTPARSQNELVTPTGALLVTSYARRFGPLPAMRVERVGYGAGDRDFPSTPNVLRVLIGEAAAAAATERIVVIECEIDDMNPQLFGALMDRLYAAGALEVFYVPVQMKKNRPGTLLTVIAPPEQREALAGDALPRDDDDRRAVPGGATASAWTREIVTVETPVGADPVQGGAPRRPRAQRRAGVRGLRAAGGRRTTCRSRTCRRWRSRPGWTPYARRLDRTT